MAAGEPAEVCVTCLAPPWPLYIIGLCSPRAQDKWLRDAFADPASAMARMGYRVEEGVPKF